ncbi:MAG: hypothetical protein ACPG06_08355, partial [Alphaproteobacteria bacterium]
HLLSPQMFVARRFHKVPHAWAVGVGVTVVAVAFQLIYYGARGYFDSLPPDIPFYAYPQHLWHELAHSVIFGYMVAGGEIIRRGFACNLRALHEKLALPVVPEHLIEPEWRGRLLVVLLLGGPAVTSILITLQGTAVHAAEDELMYIRLPILFVLVSVGVYDLLRLTQKFAHVIDEHLRPDLLKPDALEPIARFSLRSAAFLAFAVAMSSPMVLDSPTSVQTALMLGAILMAAVFVLMLPALAARRVIRKAKADEDLKIANRIEATVNELDSGVDGKLNQAALAGLFAWRQEVRQVREWVFGLETNLRFLALALVPVVSWVGGALTEGLIDRLMAN